MTAGLGHGFGINTPHFSIEDAAEVLAFRGTDSEQMLGEYVMFYYDAHGWCIGVVMAEMTDETQLQVQAGFEDGGGRYPNFRVGFKGDSESYGCCLYEANCLNYLLCTDPVPGMWLMVAPQILNSEERTDACVAPANPANPRGIGRPKNNRAAPAFGPTSKYKKPKQHS